MSELNTLFQPRSVALIGASSDTKKYGYWTAKSLIENGYNGTVHLISRSGGEILGRPTLPSILDVETEVDLAILAIAPDYIIPVVEDCAKKGVRNIIIVATGFGEVGEEGKQIERRILEIARAGGMRMMGPNCMGMYSSAASLNASIIDLAPGPMGLVLQSGNFGIDINFNAKVRKLGYSCWATIGNQVDLRFHDFVDHMGHDEFTKVLMLYMEGLRIESEEDGRRFLEVARRTSLKKPIAAIKIGRSEAGIRAAVSHTGSLAGSEKVFDAALEQAGVIRVDSPDQLLDVAEAFSKCKPAKGKRIAILTDGGGHGVMATDTAERYGLDAAILSEKTQAKLRAILKPHCPVKNPVDLAGTPEWDMWVFDRCAEVLLNDPDVDGLIIVGLYGGYADLSEEFRILEQQVAESLARRVAASDKPVVMHSIYQAQQPQCLQYISDHGIPVFNSIEGAMRTMGALVNYEDCRQRIERELAAPESALPAGRKEEVRRIFDRVRAQRRVNLVETEAREVLRAYGLDLEDCHLAQSADEAAGIWAREGKNMVMKIVSPDILHKTDAGGVLLGVDSSERAREGYRRIVANARDYKEDAEIMGVMLTPMLEPGVECIVGASSDTTFGPTVMFGLGGVFVEVLKDVAFRVAPVREPECRRMIGEIKGFPMLRGVRGAQPCDLDALAQTVAAVSTLVCEMKEIAEVDLNPVFARADGVSIADARIVLHPPQPSACE